MSDISIIFLNRKGENLTSESVLACKWLIYQLMWGDDEKLTEESLLACKWLISPFQERASESVLACKWLVYQLMWGDDKKLTEESLACEWLAPFDETNSQSALF